MILLLVIVIFFMGITLFYIITYFDWKYVLLPLSSIEGIEYKKRLCEKIGLNDDAYRSESIKSLESQIDLQNYDLMELKRSIKAESLQRVLHIAINEQTTLQSMFFEIKRNSKRKKISLRILCVILIDLK